MFPDQLKPPERDAQSPAWIESHALQFIMLWTELMPLQIALLRPLACVAKIREDGKNRSAELSLLHNRRRARTDMQNVDRVQQA